MLQGQQLCERPHRVSSADKTTLAFSPESVSEVQSKKSPTWWHKMCHFTRSNIGVQILVAEEWRKHAFEHMQPCHYCGERCWPLQVFCDYLWIHNLDGFYPVVSGWPSGLRRCVQVAVYSCRRGFESHSWHYFFSSSLWHYFFFLLLFDITFFFLLLFDITFFLLLFDITFFFFFSLTLLFFSSSLWHYFFPFLFDITFFLFLLFEIFLFYPFHIVAYIIFIIIHFFNVHAFIIIYIF